VAGVEARGARQYSNLREFLMLIGGAVRLIHIHTSPNFTIPFSSS
jgi:hypothetical protein